MGGRQAVVRETKPVNSRRYVASFDVENTTKGDSGRYRCIAQSERGVGVSSYADLTVKREFSPGPDDCHVNDVPAVSGDVSTGKQRTSLSLLQIKAAVCHIFILMTPPSNQEQFY